MSLFSQVLVLVRKQPMGDCYCKLCGYENCHEHLQKVKMYIVFVTVNFWQTPQSVLTDSCGYRATNIRSENLEYEAS